MEEQTRLLIMQTLELIIQALQKGDILLIKSLSDKTIKSASIFQDQDSISMAIITYSVSKILERHAECKEECSQLIRLFQQSKSMIEKNDINSFREIGKKVLEIVSKLDSKLGIYIEEVIEKAKIKKGSKLYEHGLSSGRAAELLGISKWELMSYVGKTKISDIEENPVNVKNRLFIARSVFNR